MHKPFLDPADLNVTSFETQAAASSASLLIATQTRLPTTEPTAETRCFYCPIDYSFDCI
jgi:hypothetical protein